MVRLPAPCEAAGLRHYGGEAVEPLKLIRSGPKIGAVKCDAGNGRAAYQRQRNGELQIAAREEVCASGNQPAESCREREVHGATSAGCARGTSSMRFQRVLVKK